MPFSDTQAIENVYRAEAMGRMSNSTTKQLGGVPDEARGESIRNELKKALTLELMRGDVDITVTRDGVIIRLREVGYFESGSATVRPKSIDSVARIAGILAQHPVNVRIEGHTDNVPIHTGRFPSNWELSTARASEITRLFITRFGFLPLRLSAAGFAEFHPISLNDTPQGRAANRRVDIVVYSVVAKSAAARPVKSPPGEAASPQHPGP